MISQQSWGGWGGKCYKIVKGRKYSHKQPGENIAEYLTYLREIPWTEEPAGLQSMGSQRVGHD